MLSADGPFASSLLITGKLSILLACRGSFLVCTNPLSSTAPVQTGQPHMMVMMMVLHVAVEYRQIMNVSVSELPCDRT